MVRGTQRQADGVQSRHCSRRSFLKSAAVVTGALAAGPLLQACNPAAGPAQTSGAKPAASKVKDKFVFIMKQDWNKVHNEYIKNEITKFCDEKGWPNDISYTEGFAAGGNIVVKLTAAVQAGDPPDGMFQDQVKLYQLKFMDLIVPLDDVVTETIKQFGEATPRLKKESFFEGNWYGIPWIVLSGGFWARKDVFEAAGIKDVNEATSTFDKARGACMQVSDPAKEMWGWGMTVNRSSDGHNNVLQPIHAWGGALCDQTGQIVTLNSPDTVAAVKWLQETHTSEKYTKMRPPGLGAWTDPSNNEALLAGKLAYTYNGGTLYAQAHQEKWAHAKDLVALRIPGGPKARLHGLSGPSFFTFKGARNFEPFKELARYMMAADKVLFLAKNSPGWCLPAYEKMWTDEVLKIDPNNPQFKDIAMDPLAYTGTPYPGPDTPAAYAVQGANVLTDMVGAVLGGQKAEDAVKSAHDKAVQIYKEYGMKATA